MSKYRVELNSNLCTSCGSCVDFCSQLFELDGMGISRLINAQNKDDIEYVEIDELKCAKHAAMTCPMLCIVIFEGNNQIV